MVGLWWKKAVLQKLEDAGYSCDMVNRFCGQEAQQRPEAIIRQDQMLLLYKQRKELLDNLRQCQKQIDCLDYLLNQMREQQRAQKA